jgi:hypothetical protein
MHYCKVKSQVIKSFIWLSKNIHRVHCNQKNIYQATEMGWLSGVVFGMMIDIHDNNCLCFHQKNKTIIIPGLQ